MELGCTYAKKLQSVYSLVSHARVERVEVDEGRDVMVYSRVGRARRGCDVMVYSREGRACRGRRGRSTAAAPPRGRVKPAHDCPEFAVTNRNTALVRQQH